MSLLPGSRFGAYEVLGPIGAGGMGEVFRAKDTNLKREVALKALPPAFVADADRLARFQREAELLAALNHPNIAQVYGLEKADGQTAIVMELVEGPTLAERIRQGPIPPDEAMAIALQVAAALEAAHAKQIVHRDLKPANVKLKLDGTVKVLDFGISKPIDPAMISGGTPVATTPAMTQTGVILGTAAYMSPEQARGRFVDQRTDIWAFGCLLFEMLTGQPAFGGEDVMLTLARVLDRDTDLSSIPRTISPAVRHTIRLCLQKDPKRRIADIRDVSLALEGRFESDLPRGADSGGAATRPLWLRTLLPAAAVLAAVVVTALVVHSLEPEPPRLRVSRQIHALPAELRPGLENNPPILAVAADGSEVAYASGAGIVRRLLSELAGRVIPGSAGPTPIAPHYSLDGRFIAYGSQVSVGTIELLRIPIEGGTPVQLLPNMPDYGWWPQPDGSWLASMRSDSCVVVRIAPGGGASDPIFEDPEIRCVQTQVLPDSDLLLFSSQPVASDTADSWSVNVRSRVTGKTLLTIPGQVPVIVDGRYLVTFDPAIGLMARAFDPETLEHGEPVLLVDDVLRMSGGQGIHGRVSATGTLVYLRDRSLQLEANRALATLDPDGRIERLDSMPGAFTSPAYSPDGRWLAMTAGDVLRGGRNSEIWIYDVSGAVEPQLLTFDGLNALPAWSADGQSILFVSDRGGVPSIWRQLADGSAPAESLTEPSGETIHVGLAEAPDGRLVYTELQPSNGDMDLYIVTLPDGEPELLQGGDGVQANVKFSPDGRAYAFVSNGDIWMARYPRGDSAPRRVSDGSGTSRSPAWSNDSTRLAFQSNEAEITVKQIDTATLAMRAGEAVFAAPLPLSGAVLDLTTDIAAIPGSDSWLIVVAANVAGDDAVGQIVVVENWVVELDERVPPLR
jgi:serine/threonine-protein kinase